MNNGRIIQLELELEEMQQRVAKLEKCFMDFATYINLPPHDLLMGEEDCDENMPLEDPGYDINPSWYSENIECEVDPNIFNPVPYMQNISKNKIKLKGKTSSSKSRKDRATRRISKKCPKCTEKTRRCFHRKNTRVPLRKEQNRPKFPQIKKCYFCSRTFKSWYLAEHVATHTGERPHNCLLCEHSSITPAAMKRHQLIHSAIKTTTLQCNVCNATGFKSEGHFRIHLARAHGPKKFACQVCPFRARLKHNLKMHERQHQIIN